MYDTIIIGAALFTEGSTTRKLIADAAKLLNKSGRIILTHVTEPMPAFYAVSIAPVDVERRRKEVERTLNSLATAAKGVKVETDMRTGNPAHELLDSARDNGADLIMIASHNPDLRDYFIGSTAARVVRHAQCSVLVARQKD